MDDLSVEFVDLGVEEIRPFHFFLLRRRRPKFFGFERDSHGLIRRKRNGVKTGSEQNGVRTKYFQ